MSALSVDVPFHEGASIPAAYRIAGATADDHSALWKFRRLQTLAMRNDPKYGPLVRWRFDALAAEIAARQKTFETRYSQTYSRDPGEAKRLLDSFAGQTVDEALETAMDLSSEIISHMARTVNKQFSFEGAWDHPSAFNIYTQLSVQSFNFLLSVMRVE